MFVWGILQVGRSPLSISLCTLAYSMHTKHFLLRKIMYLKEQGPQNNKNTSFYGIVVECYTNVATLEGLFKQRPPSCKVSHDLAVILSTDLTTFWANSGTSGSIIQV